jgi:hypothetical protein
MRRGFLGVAIALLLALGVLGLAAGGPVYDAGAATVLAQQAGPETVAPPPPGYGYGYGPGWGYGHGFSPFGFFFGPLFFLFWLALPAAIIWFVLKGRRGPGGGGPPWLAEWHRRMHEADQANPPAGSNRPETGPTGGGGTT